MAALTTAELEEVLQIRSWGRWARPQIDRDMGAAPPWWVEMMKEGYREISKTYIAPIDEADAMRLDRMISAMSDDARLILRWLYCYGYGVNLIAENSVFSKYDIRNIRDSALNQLYGALCLFGCVFDSG